ncbi:type I methionyl aminopeptidase [Dermabacter sp. p3-SID358]|uniref:type I methionyl aminopeptidase n=1 Tax=Dermabacter sp. p3-SID358 TaxID=2916114 RepID=UPI0021A5C995|nr:type I methionyl aminopeptidase [Dermabacter sp. p3-SID358]MCT1866976.1 type I methionyl aminopeptidase [Dermabacter sp. p3-SID358]
MSFRRKPRVSLKTPEQFGVMRRAGLLLARIHDEIEDRLREGMTTADIDQISRGIIDGAGARSNFLGYHGFPATVCVSVNEEIVHGIPGTRVIREGDVVSVDAGCIVGGWHSDAARTHIVGRAKSDADRELVDVTHEAMWEGIAALAKATRVGEIGAAIEDYVAERAGERIQHLEEFGGHGIGRAMHEPPDVMNFRTRDRGPKIMPGMALCIEPMLIQNDGEFEILDDDWTVVATKGGRAAHFEHSVAVTESGIFVLSAVDGGKAELEKRGIEVAQEPSDSHTATGR